jgi:hypothetical protein
MTRSSRNRTHTFFGDRLMGGTTADPLGTVRSPRETRNGTANHRMGTQ